MSTKLNDFPGRILTRVGLPAGSYDQAAVGEAIDLGDGDGRCFAILQVGSVSSGNTVQVSFEESHDQVAWPNVAGGAFPEVEAGNTTHTISFDRTRRYVRAVLAQAISCEACVLVGQPRKFVQGG